MNEKQNVNEKEIVVLHEQTQEYDDNIIDDNESSNIDNESNEFE